MSDAISGELVPRGTRVGPPSHRPYVRAAVAERRTQALQMRANGYALDQIRDHMGYKSTAAVATDITRALRDRAKARNEAADTLVDLESKRLEDALIKVQEVLARTHYAVAGGKVATRIVEYALDEDGNYLLDEDGNPKAKKVEELLDSGPILQAVDRIVKISESLRRLHGIDKPQKVEVAGTVQHQYGTEIDQV